MKKASISPHGDRYALSCDQPAFEPVAPKPIMSSASIVPNGFIAASQVTLGILAGGRAVRLGGLDKAWLRRDGVPLVLRWVRCFDGQVAQVLVSANAQLPRYADKGISALPDRVRGDTDTGHGPLAGLDAMLASCTTDWLLTLPVDAQHLPDDYLAQLWQSRDADGSAAADASGPQPLFALYRVESAKPIVELALHSGDYAVHRLQSRLSLARVDFDGVRFGNLNTLDDLAAAGIAA
jgi:molybdopterin-guanine dinucleotide biosynthesis protein A